jgi:hypothetical protein
VTQTSVVENLSVGGIVNRDFIRAIFVLVMASALACTVGKDGKQGDPGVPCSGCVSATSLAPGAVGSAALGDGAVKTPNIAVGAVGTAQIADGAVSDAKLTGLTVNPSEKAALAGSSGPPDGTNVFVTNADPRNSDARTPTVHGSAFHDASVPTLVGGLVPNAQLGVGAPNSASYLRGDRAWAPLPGVKKILFDTSNFAGAATGFFCKMPAYVAGPNEAAIFHETVSCSGTPTGGQVGVRSAFNVNGGADSTLNWTQINTNGSATASYTGASNSGFLALAPGATYVFEVQVFLGGGVAFGTCFCNFLLEVVGL